MIAGAAQLNASCEAEATVTQRARLGRVGDDQNRNVQI